MCVCVCVCVCVCKGVCFLTGYIISADTQKYTPFPHIYTFFSPLTGLLIDILVYIHNGFSGQS